MLHSVEMFLSNGANLLHVMVILPVFIGIVMLLLRKHHGLLAVLCGVYAFIQLVPALALFLGDEIRLALPLSGLGIELSLRAYGYSALFVMLAAVFFLFSSLYGAVYLRNSAHMGRFMFYLCVSLGMINGAMLSDNLVAMLFFWEGLLCTLFGMLLIGNMDKPKTAIKALALSGTADLLLMCGIIITGVNSGTFNLSGMSKLPLTGTGGLGFALMFLGAVGKAGCMPFHSWIPDAANDAPTPFLVALPGSLEKLLGIYLAARLVSNIYDVAPGGGMSIAVMTLGTLTIIFAVGMALIQKDMKRLLSYHAVSQVGYMVLGIGTCLPIGIIGAAFHMLNNALYKSCLFMVAGNVERQTGTTDLRKLGGLSRCMPVTAICFIMCALAISGVPPFNGFFSKELIFDAALESGIVFYIGALLGALLTAISFLKMGRAAFSGKLRIPAGMAKKCHEPPLGMLLPMGVLAFVCLGFGVFNTLPLDGLLGPAFGYAQSYSGWPHSAVLVAVSMAVLLLAVLDHVYGCKRSGSAINAADHIHELPGLRSVYHAAERQAFDPYVLLMRAVNLFSGICVWIERSVSWFYDVALLRAVKWGGNMLHFANNGKLSRYLALAFCGVLCIVVLFIACLA
ncbi:MAG: proton-conducting transporter membrane subunit [Clostridia bacterium]